MANLSAALNQLRAEWVKTPRGRGGIAALAGFEFQLSLAVLTTIQRHHEDSDNQILVEAISDMVTSAEDAIIVSQVKRTISSAAYHHALEELWEIYSLATQITPDRASHARNPSGPHDRDS